MKKMLSRMGEDLQVLYSALQVPIFTRKSGAFNSKIQSEVSLNDLEKILTGKIISSKCSKDPSFFVVNITQMPNEESVDKVVEYCKWIAQCNRDGEYHQIAFRNEDGFELYQVDPVRNITGKKQVKLLDGRYNHMNPYKYSNTKPLYSQVLAEEFKDFLESEYKFRQL